jgi:hypothetical protein
VRIGSFRQALTTYRGELEKIQRTKVRAPGCRDANESNFWGKTGGLAL